MNDFRRYSELFHSARAFSGSSDWQQYNRWYNIVHELQRNGWFHESNFRDAAIVLGAYGPPNNIVDKANFTFKNWMHKQICSPFNTNSLEEYLQRQKSEKAAPNRTRINKYKNRM